MEGAVQKFDTIIKGNCSIIIPEADYVAIRDPSSNFHDCTVFAAQIKNPKESISNRPLSDCAEANVTGVPACSGRNVIS